MAVGEKILSRAIGTLKDKFRIGKALVSSSALTANRAISYQDKAGTIALLSDLSAVYGTVTQASHGFTAGQVLKIAGGVFALAKADAAANAMVVGVVASVVDANNFVLQTAGVYSGTFTANAQHFLSEVTAGLLTTTEPGAGFVSKPLVIGLSTTIGYLNIVRGSINGGGGAPIVVSTDIEITDSTKGLILKSPNGNRWRVQVSNAGALTVTGPI